MRAKKDSTCLTGVRSFPLSRRINYQLLILCLSLMGVILAFNRRADSTSPRSAVTVRAAGRGRPYLNLQDGRRIGINYRGDRVFVNALQNGAVRARALASADFDGNGTPDVVAGYAFDGAGLVTLQRGNPDAF